MSALLEVPLTKLRLPSSSAHLPLRSGAFSVPPSLRHTSTPARRKLFLFAPPEHLFVRPGALHQDADINGTLNRSALAAAGTENIVLVCHCAFEPALDENSGKTMTFQKRVYVIGYKTQSQFRNWNAQPKIHPHLNYQAKLHHFLDQAACRQATAFNRHSFLASSIFLIPTLLHSLTAISDQPPPLRLE